MVSEVEAVIGQRCVVCNESIMRYGELTLINPEILEGDDNFSADVCHKWCVRDDDVEV